MSRNAHYNPITHEEEITPVNPRRQSGQTNFLVNPVSEWESRKKKIRDDYRSYMQKDL